MKSLSLNRNQLKYIVIIAMLIDHIAWAFVPTASPLGQIMHFIGRLTAPTMAFFVAEGYHYTRNFKKYAVRMAVFAAVSWVPFVFFETGRLPIMIYEGGLIRFHPEQGVIYTLFLGLMTIHLWDSEKCPKWLKIAGIIAICVISIIGDWAFMAVLWCLCFHIFRDEPKKKWTAFCIIGVFSSASMFFAVPWYSQLFQIGVFAAPLLIGICYNGEPGKKSAFNKWFFYVFYPAHMVIIGLIRWVLM